jgi:hypothetical protein
MREMAQDGSSGCVGGASACWYIDAARAGRRWALLRR